MSVMSEAFHPSDAEDAWRLMLSYDYNYSSFRATVRPPRSGDMSNAEYTHLNNDPRKALALACGEAAVDPDTAKFMVIYGQDILSRKFGHDPIVEILKCMSKGDAFDMQQAVRAVMTLKVLGANWPELDVITKSMVAYAESENSTAAKMVKKLVACGLFVSSVTESSEDTKVCLEMEMTTVGVRLHAIDIVKRTAMMSTSQSDTVSEAMAKLQRFGITAANVKKLSVIGQLYDLDDKDSIIKRILKNLMISPGTRPLRLVGYTIDLLRDLGVDWPELDAIEESVRSTLSESANNNTSVSCAGSTTMASSAS